MGAKYRLAWSRMGLTSVRSTEAEATDDSLRNTREAVVGTWLRPRLPSSRNRRAVGWTERRALVRTPSWTWRKPLEGGLPGDQLLQAVWSAGSSQAVADGESAMDAHAGVAHLTGE